MKILNKKFQIMTPNSRFLQFTLCNRYYMRLSKFKWICKPNFIFNHINNEIVICINNKS
jgi:hypothetical protein